MALRWLEGLETFGTTTGSLVEGILNRKYGNFHGVSLSNYCSEVKLATGRTGGYSLQGAFSYPKTYQYFHYVVPADDIPTNDTWIVGMAVKFESSFPNNMEILIIGRLAGSNYQQFSIKVRSDGGLSAYGGQGDSLATTSAPVLALDTWHYIEAKVVCHETAGSYEIRVDSVNVLSDSDVNTRSSGDSRFVRFQFASHYHYLDDVYICDTDGAKNNDFLGRVLVEGVFPSADGDSSDWTPSSGTDHSALVNDNPADDDTSYVESNTLDAVDLYVYTDLSTITTEPILGVQVNADVRMNEFPGDLDIKQPVKSGGTTSDGDATNIATDSYQPAYRVLEDDPATSTAWTASGVNNAQFGIKVGA